MPDSNETSDKRKNRSEYKRNQFSLINSLMIFTRQTPPCHNHQNSFVDLTSKKIPRSHRRGPAQQRREGTKPIPLGTSTGHHLLVPRAEARFLSDSSPRPPRKPGWPRVSPDGSLGRRRRMGQRGTAQAAHRPAGQKPQGLRLFFFWRTL